MDKENFKIFDFWFINTLNNIDQLYGVELPFKKPTSLSHPHKKKGSRPTHDPAQT